jgi:alpha-tubulin suppressor-like RCC1 family protein
VSGRPEPVLIPTPLRFNQIVVGGAHTCGLVAGRAYCRGWNEHGVLGVGDTESRAEFTAVAGGIHVDHLTTSTAHVCGVAVGGEAYCWGWGSEGRLGGGSDQTRVVPTLVSGGHRFRQVNAGGSLPAASRRPVMFTAGAKTWTGSSATALTSVASCR